MLLSVFLCGAFEHKDARRCRFRPVFWTAPGVSQYPIYHFLFEDGLSGSTEIDRADQRLSYRSRI